MTQVALQKELHLRKVESARSGLNKDTIFAQTLDNDTTIFAFDLMKTLPTPNLATGIVYYKRQLWTYCLGIHNLTTNQAYMRMKDWHLVGHLKLVPVCYIFFKHFVTTKKVIMYSDQCGGQNKNIRIAAICNFVTSSNQYIEKIDQKFCVSGHSYLPCDGDFGVIERETRYHENIYIPDDWVKVIASAKKKISVWLDGPDFSKDPVKLWPEKIKNCPEWKQIDEEVNELKKEFTGTCTAEYESGLPNIKRFTKWLRLIRPTA
ncbi:hypothetical protein JTB14_001154 [Gonioctena quinquepunctata]|nr:hypothetical protein JTB14_001154 [Gonioctena quinquepunctata]